MPLDPDTLTRPAPPRIVEMGLDGLLVSFAEGLDERANRAAVAFRAAVEAEGWEGVRETASTLTSTFVTFDPERVAVADLRARLEDLLRARDWGAADLPAGRRRWTIPACFEGDHAPQLGDVAEAAGLSPEMAVAEICARPLRALALGFAPGQAYLGTLPAHWDIGRQTELTPRVPEGAVVTAVRQVIVFATTTPTGWRQIGQTRFRAFRPGDPERPIPLAPGDEVQLRAVGLSEFEGLDWPDGGARVVTL